MSENLETMKRGFESFSRGDLDSSLAVIDEDVEWHVAFPLPDLPPEKTVYRGHDEVRVLWSAFRSVWDELTLDVEEVLYDQGGLLIVRALFTGKGGASGAEVSRVLFYVQELRDGRLTKIRPFETAEEAFAAAGVARD